MTGRCRDCAWWWKNESPDYGPLGWGRCNLMGSEDGKPEHPATLAFAADSDSYQAWAETSPDFGCVQFESRDWATA